MSIGKSFKKSFKRLKSSAAIVIGGGASKPYKQQQEAKQAQQNMEAFGYSNIGDLIAAQKRKSAELEERRKVTGISSLLGGNIGLG